MHGRAELNMRHAMQHFCAAIFVCLAFRSGKDAFSMPTQQKLRGRNEIPAFWQTAAPCKTSAAAYRDGMSSPSDESVTYLAQADYRDDRRVFGIRQEDRFSHVYIIGKTGTGKSTLMEKMALQDLERGRGFALIDPHGDLVERVPAACLHAGASDVIYLSASDPRQPWGYNPLRHVAPQYIALAASGLMEVLKKMWPEAWGVRMEHILRNVLMALPEQPS